MSVEDLSIFKKLYAEYYLFPAVEARLYIYEHCKVVDSEYKHNTMPEFIVSEYDDLISTFSFCAFLLRVGI